MSVKSPDIGEVCIGKYVNLSELFVRGLSLLLMKRFCMKTSRSMIFINKKAKPGRVNAEFNFTSRIFLCVDIIFLRQKQCFFKGDEFSEGWIFPSCCTVLSSAKKAVHKHHSIPLPSKATSWYVPVKWNILDPVYLGPNKFEWAKTCTDPSFVHTGPAEPCKVLNGILTWSEEVNIFDRYGSAFTRTRVNTWSK